MARQPHAGGALPLYEVEQLRPVVVGALANLDGRINCVACSDETVSKSLGACYRLLLPLKQGSSVEVGQSLIGDRCDFAERPPDTSLRSPGLDR